MQQRVTPKSLIAENKQRDYGRVWNHLKVILSLQSIIEFVLEWHLKTQINQNPNVTSSIRGYDYTICITQSQIHLFKPTQSTSKSAPKFLPESQDENVCQPLCISSWAEPASWSPKHTSSGPREYPIVTTDKHGKTYINYSQILKDSIG